MQKCEVTAVLSRVGIQTQAREWVTPVVARGFHTAVVRVLALNPARHFYERLGARCLRDEKAGIGGRAYPDTWYGWDDLRVWEITELWVPDSRVHQVSRPRQGRS